MLISEVYNEYITKYPDKKCSEDSIMQDLTSQGYNPVEILDLIDYMKEQNWHLDNNVESDVKENYYKDAINEKISSIEILLSELEDYYKKERVNICEMDDIELSQELFSELCNKITKLKKPSEKLSIFRNSIQKFFNNEIIIEEKKCVNEGLVEINLSQHYNYTYKKIRKLIIYNDGEKVTFNVSYMTDILKNLLKYLTQKDKGFDDKITNLAKIKWDGLLFERERDTRERPWKLNNNVYVELNWSANTIINKVKELLDKINFPIENIYIYIEDK